MQRFKIFHETEYRYQRPITLGAHKLLVRPRDGHDLRIEESRLEITPNALVSWHRDELDNSVALATFDNASTTVLKIVSEVTVVHYLSLRHDLPINEKARSFPIAYEESESRALAAYTAAASAQNHDVNFHCWLNQVSTGQTENLALLSHLAQQIYSTCTYQSRDEEGVQTPSQTLSRQSGSCRDYAWLFVAAARTLGFAVRFVSGYFHTAGTALGDGATHAWAEVYLPGAGWTGFDPTCNRITE